MSKLATPKYFIKPPSWAYLTKNSLVDPLDTNNLLSLKGKPSHLKNTLWTPFSIMQTICIICLEVFFTTIMILSNLNMMYFLDNTHDLLKKVNYKLNVDFNRHAI